MNERPILFNTASVQGILAGRQTQTRRVIRPQPEPDPDGKKYNKDGLWWASAKCQSMIGIKQMSSLCPYGKLGDLLWVKETWRVEQELDNHKPSEFSGWSVNYKDHRIRMLGFGDTDWGRWRSPRFMPKWAARIWFEITGVRVEKVQDISEEDALAEGCRGLSWYRHPSSGIVTDDGLLPSEEFRDLWDSINAKRGHSWETNPFVWVIEFKRIKKD